MTNDTANLTVIATTPLPTTPSKEFSHAELLDALYYIWDAFERSLMPFFLVYATAEAVMKNARLAGDKVEVGIRKMEWLSGSKHIFDEFAGMPDADNETVVTYIYRGIPIVIYVYEKDTACIVGTDQVFYEREYFQLPNPYTEFLKIYG